MDDARAIDEEATRRALATLYPDLRYPERPKFKSTEEEIEFLKLVLRYSRDIKAEVRSSGKR